MSNLELFIWVNMAWWTLVSAYIFGHKVGSDKAYWNGRRAGYAQGIADSRNRVTQ